MADGSSQRRSIVFGHLKSHYSPGSNAELCGSLFTDFSVRHSETGSLRESNKRINHRTPTPRQIAAIKQPTLVNMLASQICKRGCFHFQVITEYSWFNHFELQCTPKAHLFIRQGVLAGIQEAIFHVLPLLELLVINDQILNMIMIV